jgi:4-amino-4-deoxy-L-arabinose transferase-like glycosyltransferase
LLAQRGVIFARSGSTNAAGYQLASGEPIMAMGGFNGSDPTPTLAEFKTLVREGAVRYFLSGRSGIPGGGGGAGSQLSSITTWVQQNFGSRVVGGVTLYDLRQPLNQSALNGAADA